MIKVLVVDDSEVSRELLCYIIASDPEIQVIGTASNGEEALEFVSHRRPDVITMDINMPKMDGLEAIKRIMSTDALPIIIVSSDWKPEDVNASFKLMEVGAVAMVEKPWGLNHPDFTAMSDKLKETIKLMSEVTVITRRLSLTDSDKNNPAKKAYSLPNPLEKINKKNSIKLVVIGVSTGGPPVLQTILSNLPESFGVPILIVQHITDGFLPGFVEWLNKSSNLPVQIASQHKLALPGNVYVAPNNYQMKVDRIGRIVLTEDPEEDNLRPAVSYLFRSVAENFGSQAIGVLLTGMGRDGAKELLLMKEKGAYTIAQDKDSAVVNGMPGEAIKLGAARYILSPPRIAEMLELLLIK